MCIKKKNCNSRREKGGKYLMRKPTLIRNLRRRNSQTRRKSNQKRKKMWRERRNAMDAKHSLSRAKDSPMKISLSSWKITISLSKTKKISGICWKQSVLTWIRKEEPYLLEFKTEKGRLLGSHSPEKSRMTSNCFFNNWFREYNHKLI